MPELPEVERLKRYFDATSLHQKMSDVIINDSRILQCAAGTLKKVIGQQKFTSSHRIGKYLFAETGSNTVIVFHFGMTGHLKYFKAEEDTPKYSRALFKFNNGFYLAFVCRRMLGKIDVAENIATYKKKKKLSEDAFAMSFQTFRNNLKGRKSAIKPLLQDQSIAAGIGNWIADEILFKEKIHPATPLSQLDEKSLEGIYHSMRKILKMAVNKNAEASEYPSDYLFHHRKAGSKCPQCGGKVERTKIRGRSTYYCPDCQKL